MARKRQSPRTVVKSGTKSPSEALAQAYRLSTAARATGNNQRADRILNLGQAVKDNMAVATERNRGGKDMTDRQFQRFMRQQIPKSAYAGRGDLVKNPSRAGDAQTAGRGRSKG